MTRQNVVFPGYEDMTAFNVNESLVAKKNRISANLSVEEKAFL